MLKKKPLSANTFIFVNIIIMKINNDFLQIKTNAIIY